MIAFLFSVVLCQTIKPSISQGTVSCGLEPYTGGCGVLKKPPNFSQSFVTAEAEVSPWEAVVALASTPPKTCGAVIVDKRHVITAASCLATVGTNDVKITTVAVGKSILNPATPECQTKTHMVEAIHPYPGWNPSKPTEDDVAVIKVVGDIAFNQFVRPACLPLHDDGPYFDYSVYAETTYYTAWKDMASKLMFMKMPLSKSCPSSLNDPNSGRYERYNLICSGASPDCAQTTGSPVVADVKGIWRVLGITARSIGASCKTGLAFWRLAFYRDWLLTSGIAQVEGEIDASCPTPTYTGSCGVSKVEWIPKSLNTMVSRIINGRPVKAGQLPWQVFLDVDGDQCGGALINKNFILTAAHCVINKQKILASKEKIEAVVGEIDATKMECQQRRVYVAEIFVHPNYDSEKIVNDIALLKLTADVPFDDNIRPICLPPKEHGSNYDYSTLNGKLVAAGWGRTDTSVENSPTSTILLATDIRVVKDCPIDTTNTNRVVLPEMICSPTTTDKDTCQGDSGGPLAANIDGKWTAIGIVSAGNEECTGEASYTRVANYLDWIDSKVIGGTTNPIIPGNLVPVHVESGILSEVGLYDLKAIFCTVSAEGGVGSTGFNCKDADGSEVPKGNVVCADKIIISKRDYNDALIERIWDTQVRAGDTLVLESVKTLLNGKGLKGDDIVTCMGKSFGRESGCQLIAPDPKTYLCNDKYLASESIYGMITKS